MDAGDCDAGVPTVECGGEAENISSVLNISGRGLGGGLRFERILAGELSAHRECEQQIEAEGCAAVTF